MTDHTIQGHTIQGHTIEGHTLTPQPRPAAVAAPEIHSLEPHDPPDPTPVPSRPNVRNSASAIWFCEGFSRAGSTSRSGGEVSTASVSSRSPG